MPRSEMDALLGELEAALVEAVSRDVADVLVIQDGGLVAVCPLSRAVEDKLTDMVRAGRGNGTLPPGMALVTSGARAVATIELLLAAGLSVEVQTSDAGVARDLREAMQADSTYVSPIVRKRPGQPSTTADFPRPLGADPRNN